MRAGDPHLEQLRVLGCLGKAFFTLFADLHRMGNLDQVFPHPVLRMWAAAYALPRKMTPAALDEFIRCLEPNHKWAKLIPCYARKHPEILLGELCERVRQLRPQDGGGIVDTLEETWLRELRPKVARENSQRILQRLMRRRFGSLSEEDRTRILSASTPELEAWMDSVLDADSVQAVFRGGAGK